MAESETCNCRNSRGDIFFKATLEISRSKSPTLFIVDFNECESAGFLIK